MHPCSQHLAPRTPPLSPSRLAAAAREHEGVYDGRSRSYRPGRSAEEYDRLYAELQPLVRRLLSQYGVGDEGRRDLAVEIYYRYRQLVNAYDPDRGIPLRPYLVKGLTFSVYTHVRKQWRTARVEMRLSTAMELQPGAFAVDDTEALQPILSRDLRRMLLEAIRRLPERQRRTVLYRYYHSLSFEEIGERLQVRPATARSNLRHALETLRQELRGKLPLGE